MQEKTAGQALHRRLVFLVIFTIAVLAFAQAAHAHGNNDNHNTNGNQGSVKVDDDDIDDGPANHPHVLCALRIVVEHGVGAPFDIDFLAQPPTTRGGDDQRLLIVHVPAGAEMEIFAVLDEWKVQRTSKFHCVTCHSRVHDRLTIIGNGYDAGLLHGCNRGQRPFGAGANQDRNSWATRLLQRPMYCS